MKAHCTRCGPKICPIKIGLSCIVILVAALLIAGISSKKTVARFVMVRSLKIPPELDSTFVGIVLGVAQEQRRLNGCIRFEIFRSLQERDVFLVSEVWDSDESKQRAISDAQAETRLQIFIEENSIAYDVSRLSSNLA